MGINAASVMGKASILQICSVIVIFCLALLPSVTSLAAPAPRSNSIQQIVLRSARDQDLLPASSFLATSMYSAPSALSSIPKGQLKELTNLEFIDLKKRYSRASPASLLKFPYSLVLAEDESEGGAIVGSLGLDCQIFDKKEKKFRKLTSSSISFLSEDSEEVVVVVLSNLAVRPDKRKLGVARRMMEESERLVKEWGYSSIFLLVDSLNTRAQTLYKKRGYKVAFKDDDATCVAVGELGLKTAPCINLCYRKDLSTLAAPSLGNLFSGLFRKP